MGFIIGSIGSLSMNNDWLVVEPYPSEKYENQLG
jgi:hypothetical protein